MIREARAFFIQSYRAIAIAELILVPLITLICAIFLSAGDADEWLHLILFSQGQMVMMVGAVLADYFQFGGCLTKDFVQMNLLRSSHRGDAFYERMLRLDVIRRVAAYALAFLVSLPFALRTSWVAGVLLYGLAVPFLATAITIRLCRRFDGMNVVIWFFYLGIIVMEVLLMGGAFVIMAWKDTFLGRFPFLFLPGLIVALIGFFITRGTLRRSILKWKEHYHDAK